MVTAEQLKDKWWRWNNLYHVIDDAGHDVVFRMNNVQKDVLRDMWYRNVVLKSRKHGLSTLISILALDTALFQSNQDCQTISDTISFAG